MKRLSNLQCSIAEKFTFLYLVHHYVKLFRILQIFVIFGSVSPVNHPSKVTTGVCVLAVCVCACLRVFVRISEQRIAAAANVNENETKRVYR